MHELGIVFKIADTLEETAKEQHIIDIGSVTLCVGEVSGIMTDYFEECWDYFKDRHEVLKNSKLIIEKLPAVTYCSACNSRYETIKYGKTCPNCGSGETWLETGNECYIKEIEAETEDGYEGEAEAEVDEIQR